MNHLFSVHSTPEKFKNVTITGHFVCEENSIKAIVFEKNIFQNVFRLHENEKLVVLNSSQV